MSRIATLLIIFFTLAASIADAQDSTSVVDTPVSLPERFLIINSFDAQSMEGRKKKKELFAELADSLQQILYRKLEPRYKDRITIIPGVFHVEQNNTSSWAALMDSNQASSAIIIRHLDAYFEKTNVEVTGEKNNKTRTVSYDICSKVSYALYESDTLSRDTRIDLCLPYTERTSMSGLLTFGPDIVGKRKDAFKIIEQNANKLFLSPELPLFPRRITGPDRLRPADTALKYTISFADLAQLSYDGSKLKNYINQPFSESGDVAYYSGHYFNSRARYAYSLGILSPQEHNQNSGFYELIGVDSTQLNVEYIRRYTRSISSIGMLYQTRGKFGKAETLLSRALETRQKWFGSNSREYYNSLQNLAALRKDMGEYEEADSIFNFLVPEFEKLFGRNSIQYVVILNNKAMLMAELGRTHNAIQLLNEALSIGNSVLPPSYFDYERILTNRALVEQESGNLDSAESDYLQAIANMEKKGFDDHPDYNNMLLFYGSLRVRKNDPGVLDFLNTVAEKIRKRYKENHQLTASAYSNIGDYYLNGKSYTDARNTFMRVAGIQSKVLGEKHKDYLNTLLKLAVCEWKLKNDDNAAALFKKVMENYLGVINTLFRSMSETEKSNFWRTVKPSIDTYIAFAIEYGAKSPAFLADAYNLVLKTKGYLIGSTRKVRNAILNSGDSTTLRLYYKWLNLKITLSTYYSSTLEDLKDDNVDLADVERQVNDIEKELARRSEPFSLAYSSSNISLDDVKAALKEGEAAVEIVRIYHYYGDQKGIPEYIALVVKKDQAFPELVKLGIGDSLERSDLGYYKKCILTKTPDARSYNRYWKPLESALGKNKTIYLSQDGVYNSINLNTLQRPDSRFLLDDYQIELVSNTRELAGSLAAPIPISREELDAILIGSPEYGNDILIPPLPGSKEEIKKIDTLLLKGHLKTEVLLDQLASEKNLKQAHQPFILHIATHGFFNENVDFSKSMNNGVQVSLAKDNALLRSGLLFNGAAAVFAQEPVLESSNNGVLYAYEAMDLDLQHTGLVVLSACETGLGEIVNGEGVYGLCRSFQVAGAKKILMSLWKVDDQVTRQLMVSFYQNWLLLNDPQKALIQAQRSIKTKYPSPYFWGGFVLLN